MSRHAYSQSIVRSKPLQPFSSTLDKHRIAIVELRLDDATIVPNAVNLSVGKYFRVAPKQHDCRFAVGDYKQESALPVAKQRIGVLHG